MITRIFTSTDISSLSYKIRVKYSLKGYSRSRGTAPLTAWRGMLKFTSRKDLGIQSMGGQLDPGASIDVVEKRRNSCFFREINTGSASP